MQKIWYISNLKKILFFLLTQQSVQVNFLAANILHSFPFPHK